MDRACVKCVQGDCRTNVASTACRTGPSAAVLTTAGRPPGRFFQARSSPSEKITHLWCGVVALRSRSAVERLSAGDRPSTGLVVERPRRARSPWLRWTRTREVTDSTAAQGLRTHEWRPSVAALPRISGGSASISRISACLSLDDSRSTSGPATLASFRKTPSRALRLPHGATPGVRLVCRRGHAHIDGDRWRDVATGSGGLQALKFVERAVQPALQAAFVSTELRQRVRPGRISDQSPRREDRARRAPR